MEAPVETSVVSDPVPPPIPEKVPSVGASSLPAPPLPPRGRPPGPQIARNLPPVPPQSAALPEKEKEVSTTSPTVAEAKWLPESQAVTKTVTLKELSEDPQVLPAVIRFVGGYYGQTSSYSLSAGDYFQAHFLKHTKVMNIHDTGRYNYTVPLTSKVKFGLLPDVSHCSLGPITTGTILATKKLPDVVCAVTSGKDKKGNCLSAGDILVVKEKNSKGLKCHNLNTQSDIFIHKSFTGTFTLDPDATRMHPMELAQHLPRVFPCGAKVYHEDQEQDSSTLNGKIVTLKGCSTEVCLVATEVITAGDEKRNLVHFPCHGHLSGLHVDILDGDEKQKRLLKDDAMQLQQHFDPTLGVTYSDMISDTAVDIQRFLFQDLRPDLKNAEMNLVTCAALRKEVSGDGQQKEKEAEDQSAHPVTEFEDRPYELIDSLVLNKQLFVKPRRAQSLATHSVPPLPAPRRQKQLARQSFSNAAESDREDYVIIQETQFPPTIGPRVPAKPRPRPVPRSPVSPHSTHTSSKPVVTGVYTTLHPPHSRDEQYSTISPALPQAASNNEYEFPPKCSPRIPAKPFPQPVPRPLVSPPNTHPQHLSLPSKPNEQYPTISPALPLPSSAPPLPLPRRNTIESEQVKDQNRAILRGMNPVQVLHLLDRLHLSQYRKRFEEEVIGGDILAECDDATLRDELGVDMRIHRLKLLGVIRGDTSARELIQ